MNLKELSRPLTISDIDFRVQSINKIGYATILAYKSARVDMNRLDEVVGHTGWQKRYDLIDGNLFCSVGVYDKENNQWIWKQDVGTESMTEKEKGQASDAFKRACFNWGIGRELYEYPIISIKLKEKEEYEIGNDGKARQTWGLKLRDWKWHAQFTDGKINYLACKDQNDSLRFQWGKFVKEEVVQPDVQKPKEVTKEAPKEINDPDANIQGFLKKKTDDEILREEYTRVIGKAPHHKLGMDKMRAEIDAKISEELGGVVQPETALEVALRELSQITSLEQLKSWAKPMAIELEPHGADVVEMFKLACNNYVVKLNKK